MARIVWDEVGERTFEGGIDRGVLYLPGFAYYSNDGPGAWTEELKGVPWNGLISVDEKPEGVGGTSLYFEGFRAYIVSEPGDYTSTLKAFTYPEEFRQFEGIEEVSPGMYATQQPMKRFGMAYRTMKGNDTQGFDHGYLIHLLYDVIAIPDAKSYQTVSSNINPTIFGWTLHGSANDIGLHRPTAHVIIDSTKVDPVYLAELEDILYGTEFSFPNLPPIKDVLSKFTVVVTYLGNGVYVIEAPDEGFITVDDDEWTLENTEAVLIDDTTWTIWSHSPTPTP